MRGLGGPDRPPKRKEKTMQCRGCGHRTVHVYDWGLDRFICSEHELGEDLEEEERRYER